MGRSCSLVTAVRFLNAKNGVDYKFSLHFLPGLWYTCLRNKCHAISTICLQLRESVGCRYRRCVLCSYLEEALTHTVTHTTKRVDGHSGADRAYLPRYTERKASKSLKKQQAECPDTLRNQQVMCSSHTTSSKKHRKLRFSMLFCCKNAEKGVGQNVGQLPDPHRDPHAEMHGKGERAPERKLLPFRCSACLWDLANLRHEAAHFLRGLLLHLPCGVGVGAEGESCVVVTEH